MTVKVNGQEWQAGVLNGCASHHGHYALKNAVLTALEAGWDDEEASEATESYDESYADDEWPHYYTWADIVDDAETYLNSVTEGGIFLWTDGDFRLVETTECPECGETIDANDPPTECPDHIWWGDR